MIIKKLFILWASLAITILLNGCAPTPNDVTLTTVPGLCVTSVIPGYEALPTSYSSPYPLNAILPANSPYCMAVTITNNNTGENGNTIQVNLGLQLTSQYANNTSLSGILVDFNASGIPSSTYSNGQVQSVGNIALFDPNNCVTTIGINARYIYKNGGQCTFYLGLTGESLPVGVYANTLTVNYYNGSNNYAVSTSFNQRVNLYAGGDFTAPSNGVSLYNANGNAESLPSNFPGANVSLLNLDSYGNLFAYDGLSVYTYNGATWQDIGVPESTIIINDLSSDTLGNVYAATNLGLWVYNMANSDNEWLHLGGTASLNDNFVSVQASLESAATNTNTIFVADNSLAPPSILGCSWTSGGSNNSCDWNVAYTTSQVSLFNSQALAERLGVLYWASESDLWQLANGASLTFGNVESINGFESGALGIDAFGIIYAAFNNQLPATNNPAIASNFPSPESNALFPLSSVSGQNLYGSALGVNIRNITSSSTPVSLVTVYGGLTAFSSPDFSGSFPLAYLLMEYNTSSQYTAATNWVPISGINGNVNSVTTGSQLTSY